jgi:hypothetical protein
MDALLGMGPKFYWILAGSLFLGLLILTYVWREFLSWFLRTHEILKEMKLLKDEVAALREALQTRNPATTVKTPTAEAPPPADPRAPRISYSPEAQSLDLVTPNDSLFRKEIHQKNGGLQRSSDPTDKPQFPLR